MHGADGRYVRALLDTKGIVELNAELGKDIGIRGYAKVDNTNRDFKGNVTVYYPNMRNNYE